MHFCLIIYFMDPVELKLHEVKEWLGAGTLNFFGKPFAGKDNQAKRLGAQIGVCVFSGGEILRNSELPPEVRARMDRGELIDTEYYRQIVIPFLSRVASADKPLLLSSVGRVRGEESGVLAATEAAGHPIKAVPYLNITFNEAFRRLEQKKRGRADDNPDSLKVRIEEFMAKTEPVLATYEAMGLLVTVNAMHAKDDVFREVVHSLHELAVSTP
jgi:adenylate kinase